MFLYRAVSIKEYKDYKKLGVFRTAKNTLEGKQFFKSEIGASGFVNDSIKQRFNPPYTYLLIVEIDIECLDSLNYADQDLDGFEAITIYEDELHKFNNCVNFVGENDLRSNI